MSNSLKYRLDIIGLVLGFIGVIFIVQQLFQYYGKIDFSIFNASMVLSLGVLVLIYGLANLWLGQAWWCLLGHFGVESRRKWAIRTYGVSQLARYIPGNVFHFASRQVKGVAAGHSGRGLVCSTFLELGLLVLAASVLAIFVLPSMYQLDMSLTGCLFAGAIFIVWAATKTFFSSKVSQAFLCQLLYLMVTGVVFVGVLQLFTPDFLLQTHITFVISAYIIAWLIGLITPGAPAGIGVREVVLFALFHGQLPEAELLLVITVTRVIAMIGDLVTFSMCYCIHDME